MEALVRLPRGHSKIAGQSRGINLAGMEKPGVIHAGAEPNRVPDRSGCITDHG